MSREDAPSFPVYVVRNRHRPLSRLGNAFGEIAREQLGLLRASPLPITASLFAH